MIGRVFQSTKVSLSHSSFQFVVDRFFQDKTQNMGAAFPWLVRGLGRHKARHGDTRRPVNAWRERALVRIVVPRGWPFRVKVSRDARISADLVPSQRPNGTFETES